MEKILEFLAGSTGGITRKKIHRYLSEKSGEKREEVILVEIW